METPDKVYYIGVLRATKLTQEARLADVLELSAGLADLRSLVSHPGPRTPSEHRKRTCTDLYKSHDSHMTGH